MASLKNRTGKLPPEVNRILFVRNLPFNITGDELYEVFGRYGAIRQVRIGNTKETRGTAFVVYEDIYDAKQACEHLSGFNLHNRYLIVLYHNTVKRHAKDNLAAKEEEIRQLQKRYGVDGEEKRPESAGNSKK